jgi:polygalacturonase
LKEPRKLHLTLNEQARFFVFAHGLEAEPPRQGGPGVFDLPSFGVASAPEAVQTAAIQRAIDEVAARRCTLFVPPGIYRCGQLRMRSDVTLYLAPGAILKGTGALADYPSGELGTQQVDFTDCRNVRIYGRGVIDGQGRALRLSGRNSSSSRSKLIRMDRAQSCVVEDVILRDSGRWSIHLVESAADIRFTNFKLISNTSRDDPDFPWEPNTDGFDPDNSSRVLIERGFISTNDDAIALKLRHGTRRDMGGVRFRDNVVWTVKSALKIGTEAAGPRLSE